MFLRNVSSHTDYTALWVSMEDSHSTISHTMAISSHMHNIKVQSYI
jgi:hypothetical protein